MFTDTVGSTVAAQADEPGALRRLREQEELVRPLFTEHKGREVKSTGDGFLVEFDSALRATQCAVEIQRRMHERNSRPNVVPVQLRIGIHLGEVEQHGDDIFGDAVNIAARVEPLADPGGVSVSEHVCAQIRNKLPYQLETQGPKTLKGIQDRIDIYRVVLPWLLRESASQVSEPTRLAVLPFASMSPDPADEYFADGMTEELIDRLAQVKGLKVIARTSVMSYKKKEKKAGEIAKELAVGTLVEGSIRKAGNRVRVTVQLINAATEEHLWSAHYDRELDDIFAVQSDIAEKVATILPSNLFLPTAPVPVQKETQDMPAYLSFLQGQALVYRREEAALRQALTFFEEAIERDPTFAKAYAGIARAYIRLGNEGMIPFAEATVRGKAAAEKARAVNPDLAEAHCLTAELAFMADDPGDVQEKEAKRALELNPNLPEAHDALGQLAALRGDLKSYVDRVETAYHLDPLSPFSIRVLGRAYFLAGRPEEAMEHWKRTFHLDPLSAYRGMTDYYLAKGDLEKAREMVREMERVAPTNWATYLNRGYLAARQGDTATAMEMIAKLDATHEPGWPNASEAGFIYLALGDLDKFFEYMFTAAKDHTLQASNLMHSALFAEVRKDPRFHQIFSVAGIKLPPTF